MAALLNVPASAKRGEIIEIKTLLSHPMTTGYNRDDNGQTVARDIIRHFICRYDGAEVFHLELSPAIAANPFIVFTTVATVTGPVEFEWRDEKGGIWQEKAMLTVTA